MAASEGLLGKLHEKVTEVLIEAMDGDELPAWTEENEATGEITEHAAKRLPPSAAVIAAATKFLKDNNITCAPADDNKLGELAQRLKAKQDRKASAFEMREARQDMGFLRGLDS